MDCSIDISQFVRELLEVGRCEDLNQGICKDQCNLELLSKELGPLFLAFNRLNQVQVLVLEKLRKLLLQFHKLPLRNHLLEGIEDLLLL